MVTGTGHPSRLMMARLLANDLDASGRGEVESHIRGCAQCGAAFARAERQAADFARKHPTFESLAAGRPATAPERPAPGLLDKLAGIFGGFGLRPALAVLSVIVVAGVIWNFSGRVPSGDLTAKGGAHFFLVLNGKETRGSDIDCKPSDTLQLGITSSEPVYYAVLYRDDAGKIQRYMGGEGPAQKPLGLVDGENLPHSLVLDGGWSAEILYCVWSEHPFTLAEAEEFLKASPPTASPGGLHAQVFQLKNARS